MKSLEERQAERAERKRDEQQLRKASGYAVDNSADDDEGEGDKPKRGKKSGVTTLKDAGIDGGTGSPGAGNGGGAGAGNPFGQ